MGRSDQLYNSWKRLVAVYKTLDIDQQIALMRLNPQNEVRQFLISDKFILHFLQFNLSMCDNCDMEQQRHPLLLHSSHFDSKKALSNLNKYFSVFCLL